MYFDYRIIGGDQNMRPIRVVDDGKKTYLQMTPNAAARELPALVIVGPKGPEMVNYRVKGDMYIVDRLFERGALILGAGKTEPEGGDRPRHISRQGQRVILTHKWRCANEGHRLANWHRPAP